MRDVSLGSQALMEISFWIAAKTQVLPLLVGVWKKKKEAVAVEIKKEIIDKHERGVRVTELAKTYGRSTSTICTILKKKEQIKKLNVAKGVTVTSKHRPKLLEDVEKLLLVWINEKQLKGDSVSEAITCAKAKTLYLDLLRKTPGTSAEDEEAFKASHGWFAKFKKRTSIHSVVRHGEAASSDTAAADKFGQEFQQFITSEGFIPQQVLNCDETGLFWKKMPKRTYITQEEKSLPGHKPMKDRFTLFFCANASGDCKIKPLLVYHSENPRVFKRGKVQKKQLNVMWRANSKAWVTRQFFIEWVNEVFGPSVKKYLHENKLPLKVLLILDNATAHPPGLEDDLLEEFQFIKVKFLPPKTTPLLQPMHQQVISNFKKLYTKALFQRCFEVTENTSLTLREFWKDHFNILNCLNLIDKAWEEVSVRTLNSAWKKLWPQSVPDFGFDPQPVDKTVQLVEEIVSLGKSMGLDVDGADLDELVEENSEELTTDELKELHKEQQQEVVEELSLGEEGAGDETLSSSKIKEVLAKWEEVKTFFEENHPNKAVCGRTMNLCNDNVVSHFRGILKRRQKQVSLDKFLVKQPATKRKSSDSDPEPASSGVKFPRRESLPESEGDSPSPQ
ncbi:tigger transposable element-derived protein 1-like [Erpetoichthys calabaricus]|uniref:tigger transposable element-derived protein 1-like n=1 Tax=Erpetoichthys calabaricus TaxID=27687 RepID=UPI0022348FF8|nr:tigger transposable element-derived protein 1-like [Erpetoichthys calabaricus]